MNLKEIHIGSLVKAKVEELRIPAERIMNFLNCSENEIDAMYELEYMDTHYLLRWSKLLRYDFFRIYTGHLILYAPPSKTNNTVKIKNSQLEFRKSIYTEEVKEFIIDKIITRQMTVSEVIIRYKIPKTTLYKWIKKV
ncbi:transposase [Chryseobacterium shigense]|uniref:Transposase n=1 Tax=Chryseobacterium shigense TaxID=297244 RepID=A0A1N7IFB7_9FLAO|nr:transposase [Chryseobacterium shigense]PQA94427.1 transposase [Chryseobacterium shigense]SIS35773.1 Transposase [Chryseobacterium shigense]